MVLSINPSRTIITVSSTLLDDFIGSEASYTDIDVKIYFNTQKATSKQGGEEGEKQHYKAQRKQRAWNRELKGLNHRNPFH